PEQKKQLARRDRQVKTLHRGHCAETLRQVLDANGNHACRAETLLKADRAESRPKQVFTFPLVKGNCGARRPSPPPRLLSTLPRQRKIDAPRVTYCHARRVRPSWAASHARQKIARHPP